MTCPYKESVIHSHVIDIIILSKSELLSFNQGNITKQWYTLYVSIYSYNLKTRMITLFNN